MSNIYPISRRIHAHTNTQKGRMILFPWEGVLCLRLMLLASNYLKSILSTRPEISACQRTSDGAAANQWSVKANKNRLECSRLFRIQNLEIFDCCRCRKRNRVSMVLFAFGLLSALIDAEKARAARTGRFAADVLGKHVESDCRSSDELWWRRQE